MENHWGVFRGLLRNFPHAKHMAHPHLLDKNSTIHKNSSNRIVTKSTDYRGSDMDLSHVAARAWKGANVGKSFRGLHEPPKKLFPPPAYFWMGLAGKNQGYMLGLPGET